MNLSLSCSSCISSSCWLSAYYFFFRTKNGGEKDYFLGGRKMSGFVAALSAGASDMSSCGVMGLPASVSPLGLGQVWIAIGLAIGTVLSGYSSRRACALSPLRPGTPSPSRSI